MAEKRYYWLKLKEDYFNNPKIKKLRKIAGGDTFTIIYLKMQLFSISNNGIIEYEGIENSFDEEIALKLDEDLENVQLTLAYLKAQGLIETNNNEFLLVDACNNIGSEGDSAKRVRAFRERQNSTSLEYENVKSLQCNAPVTSVKQNSISISLSNSIYNKKENNKEKEYKEKESLLNENELSPDVEVESGSMITAESQIFDFWNECNIIKHRDMTDNIKKTITKALKTYTREDICKYIKRYAIVLEDDKYFFNYKWTLIDFLSRKDGISSFSDEGSKWVNFVNATGYTEREEVVEEVSYEDKESF